ncbi:MAG: menaquinone biosynthetic enzyme MqnA/MqnD family protein [Phycisphaerales bacterium]
MTASETAPVAPTSRSASRTRIGVVSYLNTLPLIAGLEALASIELAHAVPSGLIDRLLDGGVDLALVSAADYQKSPEPLRIVPAGMLGCRGRTMTVRLYSRVPIPRISIVHGDTDSHTSVILLQVLLRERHGLAVEMVDFDARSIDLRDPASPRPESLLLIGDKVIVAAPDHREYPYQLDLGEAWLESTGKPFVFATWMCRRDLDEAAESRVRTAAAVLDHQRRHNRTRLSNLVHRHAIARGWPKFDADLYLSGMLRYEFGDAEAEGLRTFFAMAHRHGLLAQARPLEMLEI